MGDQGNSPEVWVCHGCSTLKNYAVFSYQSTPGSSRRAGQAAPEAQYPDGWADLKEEGTRVCQGPQGGGWSYDVREGGAGGR